MRYDTDITDYEPTLPELPKMPAAPQLVETSGPEMIRAEVDKPDSKVGITDLVQPTRPQEIDRELVSTVSALRQNAIFQGSFPLSTSIDAIRNI